MFDVAVIGAGPAGSMAARLLAEKGYSTALVEEHLRPGDSVNCSGVIGTEAFERFDLPREVILRQIDSFRFYSPKGNAFDYTHSSPLAVAVDRAKFDWILAQKAVETGAVLLNNTRVSRIELRETSVRLTHGQDETLESKFVILATGAGSKLTRQLKLGSSAKFVLGVQTECETSDLEQVEIHLGRSIAACNFAWLIPLQSGRAKVGLICETKGKESLKNFLNSPLVQGRIFSHSEFQCSLLPLETLRRTYAHRTLIVGEAAGQIKTITCGGIYYALLAAEIAADVLDASFRSGLHNIQAMAAYQYRWKQLFSKELKTGRRLRALFERFSDDQIQFLFEIAGKDGLMSLIRKNAHFDWHHDLVSALFRHSLFRAVQQPLLASRFFA